MIYPLEKSVNHTVVVAAGRTSAGMQDDKIAVDLGHFFAKLFGLRSFHLAKTQRDSTS